MPAGKCANCDAAVSYFARACARCGLPNQPNAVTTGVALALLVVLGGAVYLGARAWLWSPGSPAATTTVPQNSTPATGEDDFGWLLQAMAECDVYAKQNADTLYFLIIPLAPSGKRVTGWDPAPLDKIGSSALLVSSQDALLGLRNGVFVLYRKPVTFAVRDPATQTIFKWKPSTGVSELKSSESKFASLTLGLQVGESADLEWGPSFSVVKGTCYWVMPVIGMSPGGNAPSSPAPR